MRLSQLYRMSDEYLAHLMERSEYDLSPRAFEAIMAVTRSVRLIKEHLNNAFLSKEKEAFFQNIDLIEEESDEAIYHLDKLRREDKYKYAKIITDGEELLSHYVIAYNLLIEKNIKTKYRDSQ